MKLRNLFEADYFQAKPNRGMIVKFRDAEGLYVLVDYKKMTDRDGHWDGDGRFDFRSVSDPTEWHNLSTWSSQDFEKVLTPEEAAGIKIVEEPKPEPVAKPAPRKLTPQEIEKRRQDRDTWESDQYDIEREQRPW